MGLINDNGFPIKKPWTIATNDGYLWRAMSGCKCLAKRFALTISLVQESTLASRRSTPGP
eukprot:5015844-Heterocapsa_arctica.AAC.1